MLNVFWEKNGVMQQLLMAFITELDFFAFAIPRALLKDTLAYLATSVLGSSEEPLWYTMVIGRVGPSQDSGLCVCALGPVKNASAKRTPFHIVSHDLTPHPSGANCASHGRPARLGRASQWYAMRLEPRHFFPYFFSGSKTFTPSSVHAPPLRTHEKHER